MKLNNVLINDESHVVPTTQQKIELFTLARKYLIDYWGVYEPNSKCICDCLNKAQEELGYLRNKYDVIWSRNGRGEGYGYGNNMESNFPELLKYKPKNKCVGEIWWSMIGDTKTDYGHKRRIRVCTMVIMDLQKQLRSEI